MKETIRGKNNFGLHLNDLLSQQNISQLLNIKNVAEQLSVGKSTVYEYINKGILKAVHLPSISSSKATQKNRPMLRVRVEDLQAFMHNCAKEGLRKDDRNGNY
jgi:predicted DNA-binding transcriptional regulator AlpA